MSNESGWSPPHSHEPNPAPPSADPNFAIHSAGNASLLTPEVLRSLPQRSVDNCYIVSTGHGTSGPFTFSGVGLLDLVLLYTDGEWWAAADVLSADGFRTRISRDELTSELDRPIILALSIDGEPMSRYEGLVRLIVPGEESDALRQVKWVSEIQVIG